MAKKTREEINNELGMAKALLAQWLMVSGPFDLLTDGEYCELQQRTEKIVLADAPAKLAEKKKWQVSVRAVYTEKYVVLAASEEEAKDQVAEGAGITGCDPIFEYAMESSTWETEELDGK